MFSKNEAAKRMREMLDPAQFQRFMQLAEAMNEMEIDQEEKQMLLTITLMFTQIKLHNLAPFTAQSGIDLEIAMGLEEPIEEGDEETASYRRGVWEKRIKAAEIGSSLILEAEHTPAQADKDKMWGLLGAINKDVCYVSELVLNPDPETLALMGDHEKAILAEMQTYWRDDKEGLASYLKSKITDA